MHVASLIALLALSACTTEIVLEVPDVGLPDPQDPVDPKDASGPSDPDADDLEPPTGAVPRDLPEGTRIVGYYMLGAEEIARYPDVPYSVQDIVDSGAVHRLTHLNFAFAHIDEAGHCAWTEDVDLDQVREVTADLAALRDINPGLRTLVALGGWALSNDASTTVANYRDAVATPEARRELATSCADFADEFGFDGIDIDWEYPRASEADDFVAALAETRAELDRRGGGLLTIAGAGGAFFMSRIHHALPAIVEQLDFVNLMTYDLNGPWQGVRATNFNAHLYGAGTDGPIDYHQRPYPTESAEPMFYNALRESVTAQSMDWFDVVERFPSPFALTVDAGVQQVIDAGVPVDKIVMGVPFYGRAFKGVPDGGTHGLYQPFSTPGGDPYPGTDVDWLVGCDACIERREPRVATWTDIQAMLAGNYGYARYWHEDARVPWLYNAEHQLFVSYDDPESLGHKAQYAIDHGLGGVMFWHLGHDDPSGTLLRALHTTLSSDGR